MKKDLVGFYLAAADETRYEKQSIGFGLSLKILKANEYSLVRREG